MLRRQPLDALSKGLAVGVSGGQRAQGHVSGEGQGSDFSPEKGDGSPEKLEGVGPGGRVTGGEGSKEGGEFAEGQLSLSLRTPAVCPSLGILGGLGCGKKEV